MKKINLILRSAILLTLIFTGCNNNNENKSNSENKESISENSELDGEVTIGTQKWMSANLDVKAFRNGEAIPQAKTDEEWKQAGDNNQPAWCYYDNDPDNGAKYGKLYNWYAVNDSRGLAPVGYHIPTNAEWEILIDFLGSGEAGKKMKSRSGWKSYTSLDSKTCPNCESWNREYRNKVPCHICKDTRSVTASNENHSGNSTNSSGFSCLPGGARFMNGAFSNIVYYGVWWSSAEYLWDSSEETASRVWIFNISYELDCALMDGGDKRYGFSVRCLRD